VHVLRVEQEKSAMGKTSVHNQWDLEINTIGLATVPAVNRLPWQK
jgi:nitrogen fixation protein